jgi:hypothetical protein
MEAIGAGDQRRGRQAALTGTSLKSVPSVVARFFDGVIGGGRKSIVWQNTPSENDGANGPRVPNGIKRVAVEQQ